MSKGFWVAQEGHYLPVIPPVSAGAAQTSKRFNLANFAHASVILMLGAAAGPIGAITVNVYQAETGGAGGAMPYRIFKQEAGAAPFDVLSAYSTQTASGYTPAADAANAAYVIEFDAQELLAANNGTYVEVDIAVGSMGTAAQLLAALAILSGGRNMSDQQASAQI
jgi:hypothetical protein